MTQKNNAAGRDDTAANKTATPNHKPKTRITMLCPCCSGQVTHQRYGFDMIVASPLRMMKWYVCDECEAALSGEDEVQRQRVEQAFLDYLEGTDYAIAP